MKAAKQKKPEVNIAPTVFVAYTDITATASRALYGLEVKDRQYQTLKIPVLEGAPPACVQSPQTQTTKTSPPMDSVQVINCRFKEKDNPQITFLILNTHVSNAKSHFVAKTIVDLCTERHVMKLAVLTTQRLDVEQRSKLYENACNGMAPVTQRSRLPDDTIVMDAFLSSLIQLCTVEGQPFSVIMAPAHRCSSGQANAEDGSLQLIRLFQNTLMGSCGLMFSEKLSTSLVYHETTDDAHSGLMYA
ncbi:uncharacterized protein LOC143287341 [Babylonia areolata]|uniref:uncharacterized protein LOC143287341 n=1 Tax=Babylonia areolata TaxID=304850 RepID=UPI003FD07F8B